MCNSLICHTYYNVVENSDQKTDIRFKWKTKLLNFNSIKLSEI